MMTINADYDLEAWEEYAADQPPDQRHHALARRVAVPDGFFWNGVPCLITFHNSPEWLTAPCSDIVHAGIALRRMVDSLGVGIPEAFDQFGGGYGLVLHAAADEDEVTLSQARGRTVATPARGPREGQWKAIPASKPAPLPSGAPSGSVAIRLSLAEFKNAVEAYWRWVLTDFAEQAPWLSLVPEFVQWQDDAGVVT